MLFPCLSLTLLHDQQISAQCYKRTVKGYSGSCARVSHKRRMSWRGRLPTEHNRGRRNRVGTPLRGCKVQQGQAMGFGRWQKVRAFSVASNEDKGFLKGLVGLGVSNLSDPLTYLRPGEECSALLFQSLALVSGIPPAQMCQELSLPRQTEIT